jgi:hypothetical protein
LSSDAACSAAPRSECAPPRRRAHSRSGGNDVADRPGAAVPAGDGAAGADARTAAARSGRLADHAALTPARRLAAHGAGARPVAVCAERASMLVALATQIARARAPTRAQTPDRHAATRACLARLGARARAPDGTARAQQLCVDS